MMKTDSDSRCIERLHLRHARGEAEQALPVSPDYRRMIQRAHVIHLPGLCIHAMFEIDASKFRMSLS